MNPHQEELFVAVRGVVTAFRELDIEYFVGGSHGGATSPARSLPDA